MLSHYKYTDKEKEELMKKRLTEATGGSAVIEKTGERFAAYDEED